jgi:3-deoxy-D-manno-octulosonate 8-phosphate phosphatase KdsC-like HAD superfamily phosphatase
MDVQKQDESLTVALSEATKVIKNIAAAVTAYCEANGGKGKCKNVVDVSSYEIEAKYQTVKRED